MGEWFNPPGFVGCSVRVYAYARITVNPGTGDEMYDLLFSWLERRASALSFIVVEQDEFDDDVIVLHGYEDVDEPGRVLDRLVGICAEAVGEFPETIVSAEAGVRAELYPD